jgi:cytidine deaminase
MTTAMSVVTSITSLAVLRGKLAKRNILSFGQNHYPCNGKTDTIHAEHDAINKLPFKRNNDKTKINMLVLRFTKNFKMCMSKPCDQCINNMVHLFPKKGYIIKDIYYSNTEGNIEKTTLDKIVKK